MTFVFNSVYKMTITITTSDGIVDDAERAEQTNDTLERALGEYRFPFTAMHVKKKA